METEYLEPMGKGLIYSNQLAMFTKREIAGYGDDAFCVREIERGKANAVIIANHYSGKIYNATYIHLGIYISAEFVGVLQFGYAMNPASCGSVVEGTEMDQYLELNRMWLSDAAPRNSESMALSYAIAYIRNKFKRVKWIQSFADERCGGFGIVYQAANFLYYGEHDSVFWEFDGEVFHNSIKTSRLAGPRGFDILNDPSNLALITKSTFRQFRYIYWIDQSWKGRCKLRQKEYIKHYNDGK